MKHSKLSGIFAPKLTQKLVVALTLVTLGCSGGGGNDVVVNNPSGGGGSLTPPAPSAQTFNFPSFSNNSRLTVVSNFQTATETSPLVGQTTTVLSELGAASLARARFLGEQGDAASNSGDITEGCGFADAYLFNQVAGEAIRPQSINSRAIRPRFQELSAGSRQDIYMLPVFRNVVAEKILEPSETTHCTILAEVVGGQPVVSREKALAVAQAFDSNNPQRPGSGIYDQVRAVFGSEWNQNPPGGNDGDQKIVIMFFSPETLSPGLFGFTSPADGNPNGGGSSNKAEIIYINSGKSEYQTLATISHEFQHLVNQNEKVNQQGLNPSGKADENVAVNEGLSGLSEEVCGYTFESGNELLVAVCNNYLEKPEEHSFFNFFEAGLGYGEGYLFFKYVREHFGDQMIRSIAANPGTGLANLNDKLPGGFPEIFRRWTIANYATNLSGPVPNIYTYPSGFRTDGTYPAGTLVGVKTFPMSSGQSNTSPSLKEWSASYSTLDGKPGAGLTARITPASGDSPFGVLFESTADQFTSFDD